MEKVFVEAEPPATNGHDPDYDDFPPGLLPKAEGVFVNINGKKIPVIETNNRQLRDKRNDTLKAMEAANDPPTLFHGDAGLVFIGQDKKASPILKPVTREVIQNHMADAAQWISTAKMKNVSKDGKVSWSEVMRNITPPRDMAENYLAQPRWPGVPAIDGIVTAPLIAQDAHGKKVVCSKPGYHPVSRLWLSLPPGFEMPDTSPTTENRVAAHALIFETLLGEVAFADDASKAHAFALMILPFVRLLIDGPTPMHLFDAPTQSSGKSTSAEICIAPFTTPCASVVKGEDEEWRKAIMAALIAGRSHYFLDNVKGRLNSPMLAAAITSGTLTERAMGGLGEVTARVRCVWVATSNNAVLDADASSRCILIRLDTNMENPESRKFSHNPLHYIASHRAEVIGALFTFIRQWIALKCPVYKGEQQGRFQTWQEIIGGILEANEITGFLENMKQARATLDPEKAAWTSFCELWAETHNTRLTNASALIDLATQIPELAAGLGDHPGRSQTIKLGKLLQFRRDKMFGTFKINAGIPDRNGATYFLSEPGMEAEGEN
jgi:hypothetical protein